MDYPSQFPMWLHWDFPIKIPNSMVYQDYLSQIPTRLLWDYLTNLSSPMVYPNLIAQFPMICWDFLISNTNPIVYQTVLLFHGLYQDFVIISPNSMTPSGDVNIY